MKNLLVDNLLVDNMVDFTVGQQVLVPDREYPANGSVGGTIQWLFDGPDGVKQCTVVLPVGRVRVYNCTDLLQYNVEDDFYGEVNRCIEWFQVAVEPKRAQSSFVRHVIRHTGTVGSKSSQPNDENNSLSYGKRRVCSGLSCLPVRTRKATRRATMPRSR